MNTVPKERIEQNDQADERGMLQAAARAVCRSAHAIVRSQEYAEIKKLAGLQFEVERLTSQLNNKRREVAETVAALLEE